MLNLTTIMISSEDPKALSEFYKMVLGEPGWARHAVDPYRRVGPTLRRVSGDRDLGSASGGGYLCRSCEPGCCL